MSLDHLGVCSEVYDRNTDADMLRDTLIIEDLVAVVVAFLLTEQVLNRVWYYLVPSSVGIEIVANVNCLLEYCLNKFICKEKFENF